MVGVVISGTGDVSTKHYKAVKKTKNGELLGIYSRDKKRGEEVAKEWHTKYYGSLESVIDDPDVDIVVICTADELHYPQAIKLISGGKNVLVEKPPALSLRDIVHMAKLSREKGVLTMPVHNFIFRRRILDAKERLESGEIGTPTYAFFSLIQRMPEERAKRYHGAFLTQAYHQIYLSNFLMGVPAEMWGISGIFTYKEVRSEEMAIVTFKYKNGAAGHIVINWCINDLSTHSWMWLEKIIGTNGIITVSTLDDYAEQEGIPYRAAVVADYANSFVNIHRHLIDEVLAEGKEPLQTVYDAVVVMDMIEKLKSSASEGEVVKYSPPNLDELARQLGV